MGLLANLNNVEIGDPLSFLCGSWKIERTFDDRGSARSGRFIGTGEFIPVADRTPVMAALAYQEQGVLSLGGHVGQASRRLEYRRSEGDVVELFFEDGRRFVDLSLVTGWWRSTHRCDEDTYEIITTVVSQIEIVEHWSVTGPSKDYDAVTVARRFPN